MGINMNSVRSYSMNVRAARAEQTRRRIVAATIELALSRPLAACTLPAIAERAETTVQTILRSFGSRDALFAAAVEAAEGEVVAERTVDPADVAGSLAALVDHYERVGDGMLLLGGQETSEPLASRITTEGKAVHRAWVERLFAPTLASVPGPRRAEAVDLLVAATDLSAWKLWRRDAGRSPAETLARFTALVSAVVARLEAGL